MAKRQPITSICGGCLAEFLDKEMYTVEKYVNRGNPNPKNTYYAPYCKKCVKGSNTYYRVHQEPIIK